MFAKLLNDIELSELKSMIRELNRLMENCALGNNDSCTLANIQYQRILQWKKNKMSEKIKELDMENKNNLSFSTRPLNTGKFVQTPRKPTFFQAVNSIGECNYSIPNASQNPIPFEGQVKAVNFVGAPRQEKDVDDTIQEISALFAEFDAEQEMEDNVSGYNRGRTVGRKFFGIKVPTLKDIKREVTQALDPRHMVKQFKKVTKKTLNEIKDWGKRILKNPAELLHPPLPKTGNDKIDKELIERIEKAAKKVDPAWQISDLVEKHVIDPMLGEGKESKRRSRPSRQKRPSKWSTSSRQFGRERNLIKRTESLRIMADNYIKDMERKFESLLLNNPFLSDRDKLGLKHSLDVAIERLRRRLLKHNPRQIAQSLIKKAKRNKTNFKTEAERYITVRLIAPFREMSDVMIKNAGFRGSWDEPDFFDQVEKSKEASRKSKVFQDLFAMIKNRPNTGIFEGSCGPHSEKVGTKKVNGKEYLICKSYKPKSRTVWREKDVRVQGVTVAGDPSSKKTLLLLIDFIKKLKRVKSAGEGEKLIDDYEAALGKLATDTGIFEGEGCGIHANKKSSIKIGGKDYSLCTVVPGQSKIRYRTKKVFRKVRGTNQVNGINKCSSCMIEDLSLNGANPNPNYSNFYKMAGIKHFSGNTMEGRKITKM